MFGDWGLGIGDWKLNNPKSPIPNPQSPLKITTYYKLYFNLNFK